MITFIYNQNGGSVENVTILNMIKLILAALAIHGYIANIANQKLKSYIIWLISNTGWAIYNGYKNEYELMAMFLVYNGFCIYGIIRERRINANNIFQKS